MPGGNPDPNHATRFKKGQSGNPNGRPKKGYSITEWFREMLNSNPDVRDAIGKSIVKKALEGDSSAQRLVWNYMDGQPEIKGEIETQITINFHSSLKQDELPDTV